LLLLTIHAEIAVAFRLVLMLLGSLVIYLCSHSIAHRAVGRLVGISFCGHEIGGARYRGIHPPSLSRLINVLSPVFRRDGTARLAESDVLWQNRHVRGRANLNGRLFTPCGHVCAAHECAGRWYASRLPPGHRSRRRDGYGNGPVRRLCSGDPRVARATKFAADESVTVSKAALDTWKEAGPRKPARLAMSWWNARN
jgi:hypothetical protein